MVFPLPVEKPYNVPTSAPPPTPAVWCFNATSDDWVIENVMAALTTLTNPNYWNGNSIEEIMDIVSFMTSIIESLTIE